MVLASFLVAVALAVAATVYVTIQGIRLYRQTKRTGRALSAPLDAFEEKVGEIDRHLDAFESSATELERARAQLARSTARLQILLDEIRRARGRVRWLRAFLPAR